MSDHPTPEMLIDYACGELAADDTEAIDAHIGGCVACRGEVEETRELFAQLDALPRELLPLVPAGDGRASPAEQPRPDEEGRSDAERHPAQILPLERRPAAIWSHPAWRVAAVVTLLASGVWIVSRSMYTDGGDVAVVTSPPARAASETLAEELARYRSTTDDLVARVRERREVGPESAVTVGLASLDRAVSDTERALDELGENPVLEQMLVKRYQQRIELLRRSLDVEETW